MELLIRNWELSPFPNHVAKMTLFLMLNKGQLMIELPLKCYKIKNL